MEVVNLETITDMSRGAGLGHSMEPSISVQNKNFTRNPEKLAEVPGTREES